MKKIKEETVKAIAYWIITIPLVCLLTYGCWRAERYLNWKFGYGPKVAREIKALEERVSDLEGKSLEK